ncbi:DUF6414 family protein [Butyrivibrio fibrisolvens]|uniref:DUF6414 family protein n=1 Tax=Butyrivibrio fibrisolvens TaxID=831 RepID=UPI0012BBD93F|nr:hypothetical protein [Butyrivibrio fibrisolvens]
MKHFLYFDTDIINSIIAQSEKGLIQNMSSEFASTEGENDESATSVSLKGGIGSGIKILQAEAEITGRLDAKENTNMSSISKEIFNKILHDATCDVAYSYINPIDIELDNPSGIDTGVYVEIERKL